MEQKNTRHNEDRLLAPFHGPALKAMRQTMGYTQEAFAAASGIGSRAFVNRLERPDAKPDRNTVLRIMVFVDDFLIRCPEMRAPVYRCIRDNMIDPENDWNYTGELCSAREYMDKYLLKKDREKPKER